MTIKLRVAELLKDKGWTAYRLADEAGISITLAYRLARPAGTFKRMDRVTLEKLCDVFGVEPGELLVRVRSKKG